MLQLIYLFIAYIFEALALSSAVALNVNSVSG